MDIEQSIQEFRKTFLPPDFRWRNGQKEAIAEVIKTYDEGIKKVVILDAPVGSGKSIIAMAISWILNQKGKRGYILASDIALQEQYETDFKKFGLAWGSVKGIDNYTCIDNSEKLSMGTCKIKGMEARKMSCYYSCPYFSARDLSSSSDTSLMNYSYWMIMQNSVNPHSAKPIFPPRDFTICDEGHKILDIVQGQYSPKIDKKLIDNLSRLTEFYELYKVAFLSGALKNISERVELLKDEENQDELLYHLEAIAGNMKGYISSAITLKHKTKERYPDGLPPKEWRRAIRISDSLIDFFMRISDFVKIIKITSSRNLVKNPSMNGDMAFNCLEENYLMQKYFHRWNSFTVIMSATFSDPSEYIRQISVGNAKYIKLDSSFDFSGSPIYYYNQKKMGFKDIDKNIDWLYKTINSIIKDHDGDNGIIHTASYSLALKIYENLDEKNRRRVVIYEGSEEKRMGLEQLKTLTNKILMGPSLLEGLDLKHDWSRFQIFAKIPYLSLADRFVKAKLAMNPGWYRWKAILNILQGIGRSVRSENDWAITYILDASLSDLIRQHPKAFPPEFMKRIQIRKE